MRSARLLLTMCTAVCSTPAYASQHDEPTSTINVDASEMAAQAFWKGKAHYEAGELLEAIEQFKLAYGLTNDPDLLYNIAQSYRKAGHCSLALVHYRDFLELAPASPLAGQAEKQVVALRGSCESRMANSPPAGDSSRPVEDAANPVVVAASPTPRPAAAPQPHPNESELRPKSRLAETWALIALSGAAIGGGVALGLKLWNHERHNEWQARDRDLANGNAQGESDIAWAARQAANDELARSIERVNREASYVSIGAGALLATGALLYFLKSPTAAPAAQGTTMRGGHGSSISIGLGLQHGGPAVVGVF